MLRIGTVGATVATLPWALCSGIAACTQDPLLATRLLRIGNGPVALVGPGLLLVLLGVSGQLERHRWVVRVAGVVGAVLCALCWATPWTVGGVHRLRSGILYPAASPLTVLHFSQLAIWLGVGVVIARRSVTGRSERRQIMQMVIGVLALGAIGATDMLLVYDVVGSYPVSWLPALLAAVLTTYYCLRSDLLRPQGLDRDAMVEVGGFVAAVAIVAVLVALFDGALPVTYAVAAGVVWIVVTLAMWTLRRGVARPIARERALEQLVAKLTDVESQADVMQALGTLWSELAIRLRTLVVRETGDDLEWIDPATGDRAALSAELAAWLAFRGELVAAGDLGTMRLGALRPSIEGLVASASAGAGGLVVPLVDRGALVGLALAEHTGSLREDERGLVTESARVSARALGYVRLTREAARERETAREVEVAEAMRLQASASRDATLGRWIVAAEYRSAAHTTGSGWSTALLADGRLAVLVTDAQTRGVAAALATAAVTGAFAAATSTTSVLSLESLLGSLRSSAEGVVRGGEPVTAFLSMLDPETGVIEWASAGYPGAAIVGPVPELGIDSGSAMRPIVTLLGGGGARLGASAGQSSGHVATSRGRAVAAIDSVLVIASAAVRGDDDEAFSVLLRERAAAGGRLAHALVDAFARSEPSAVDLLAVVVRLRAERRSVRRI